MTTENTGLRKEAVVSQVSLGGVCATYFSANFKRSQGTLMFTWGPKAPPLPETQGIIWIPGETGTLL